MTIVTEGDGPVIGIDLGTMGSCVAVSWQQGYATALRTDPVGYTSTTPSWIECTDSNIVGLLARDHSVTNPTNTIFRVKQMIGRRFSDKSVQEHIKSWPFKVIAANDDLPMIIVHCQGEEKQYAPEEIIAMLLAEMVKNAKIDLGQAITKAIITVPFHFNSSQCEATITAGTLAGLNVISVIKEPTAAAIAYCREKKLENDRIMLVFDLGGSTLDVTLLHIFMGNYKVKAATHLPSVDFNKKMISYCMENFIKEHKRASRGIKRDQKAMLRLWAACESAKISLSSMTVATVDVALLYGGLEFCIDISSSDFEFLNKDLFTSCMDAVEECLHDAQVNKNSVDSVVLVGGSTRIPKVRNMLRDFFHGKELCQSINPDVVVAHGAAIKAAMYLNVLRSP